MIGGHFFVLGNPRSGTSLFRTLLNAHPKVLVPPECGFILWLKSEWGAGGDINDDPEGFADAVVNCRKFETWGVSKGSILETLRTRPVMDYLDGVTRVFEAYAAVRGKEIDIWGDKNNYYIDHVPELSSTFPSASFLHIIRDVRDVACSYRELASKEIGSKYRPVLAIDVEEIAREWIRRNETLLTVLAGDKRLLTIRYEDLVGNSKDVMDKVWDHLQVERWQSDHSDRLKYFDEPAEFLQWKERLAAPVDELSVGRYGKELSSLEMHKILSIAAPLMEKFGYLS